MLTRIGRFEIQDEIGRGGFGRVYRAFDPKVGRVVAIKVLDSDGSGDQSRFRNEATAAGNLHHRNIVTVYEFGEDQGVPYLVMEYLQGEDLQKALKKKTPLPLLRKVSIMAQVADGLHCAHSHGVLHRDVKPANIMLLNDGSVKIMDFGIARLTVGNAARLTQTGFLIGTVMYMAPEQFLGDHVDALCDVWSYGVIYYELLAGRNPFETGSPQSEMYKITHEDPPPLTSANCPETLAKVVRKLLAKERELRYQSLEDVQFDIEPILSALQKQEAEGLLAQARDQCKQEQWERAQPLVKSVLELDSQNSEARVLRERIQAEMHRLAVKPKVDSLIQRGEEEADRRRFTEAIVLFDSARKLDSGNLEIQSRLEFLRTAKERSERARALAADAKRELEGNQLTTAFKDVVEALRIDAEHPEANLLLSHIQQEIEKRERERKIEEQVQRARLLVEVGGFDEAMVLLAELAEANPARGEIRDLRTHAAALKSEKERRGRLLAGLNSSGDLLKSGQLAEAVRVLSQLLREFPESTEVSNLLVRANEEMETRERAAAIDAIRGSVTSLVHSHRYDEALNAVQKALRAYPGEASLSGLLYAVVSSKQAHEEEERRYFESQLAAIAEREGREDWSGALELLRPLLHKNPGGPAVAAVQRRIEEGARQAERRREIAAEVGAIRKQLAAGDWPAALARIGERRAFYRDQAAFQDVWAEAQQQREQERNTILSEVRGLLHSGDLEGADAAVKASRTRFPRDVEFTSQLADIALARTRRQEQLRAEQARAEQLRLEQVRAEQQRAEQARVEQTRLEQARAEQQRLEQVRVEQQRAEQTRAEKLRLEQARAEQQRAEQTRAEQLRLEQVRAEQLRAAEQVRVEQQRAEQARAEKLRLEQARAEQQQAEQTRAEQLRLEQVRAEQLRAAEQARAEQLRAEQARAEQLRLEQVRAEQLRAAEQARVEQQRAEQARAEQLRLEQVRAEQLRAAEQARVEQQRAEQARAEKLRLEQARAEQERAAEQARVEQQRAEQARAEKLRLEQARAEQERAAEQARVEQQRAEQVRAEQLRAAEQARVEQQRAEQARAEQLRERQLKAGQAFAPTEIFEPAAASSSSGAAETAFAPTEIFEPQTAAASSSSGKAEQGLAPTEVFKAATSRPPQPTPSGGRSVWRWLAFSAAIVLILAILLVARFAGGVHREAEKVAVTPATPDRQAQPGSATVEPKPKAASDAGSPDAASSVSTPKPGPKDVRVPARPEIKRGPEPAPPAAPQQAQPVARPTLPIPPPVERQEPPAQAAAPPPAPIPVPVAASPKPKPCVPEPDGDIRNYHDLRNGTISWVSTGQPATRVIISSDGRANVGNIKEGADLFPNRSVIINFVPSGVVKVVDPPNSCNEWQLVLDKPAGLDHVDIKWTVP